MLYESVEHRMDAYAVDLNSFCDTVLKRVDDYSLPMGNKRLKEDIIFSSVNPDVCLIMPFKQPNYSGSSSPTQEPLK